jgi:starvation-inducible DNA-binding protein
MAGTSESKALTFSIPRVSPKDADAVVDLVQERLNALNDLALMLKHIHWNVVGPNFIGVHTMLDPQVDAVRKMVDTTAERIAAFGGSPCGTPGAVVSARSCEDYALDRDDALAHMGALDVVYAGVIEAHRKAIEATEVADPVTQDMLINRAAQLEQQQWFVRAHVENAAGSLSTELANTETQAASRARR